MKRNLIFLISFIIISSYFPDSHAQNFSVEGTNLLDPGGKVFIMRGVNNPHAWYYDKSMKSLAKFREYNMNSVRIVWESGKGAGKLKDILDECILQKLVPVLELHDATGDTSEQQLLEMTAFLTDPKTLKVLMPYEEYLLINIANEWGTHDTPGEFWKKAYIKSVKEIRDAGYKTPIVIDAPGWGQNHQPILEFGKDIIEADPLHNIVFSIHMYGSWNDPNKIETELQKLHDASLPVMVGEFGYNFDKGFNNLDCMVDHIAVMKTCHKLGYGYLAWSWCGNNKVNAWLDMVDKRGWKELTWWGRQVIYSEYGINNNAQIASVFPDETEAEKEVRMKNEARMAKKTLRQEKRTNKLMEQNKKQRELAKERSEKLKVKADAQKEKQMERMKERRAKKAEQQEENEGTQ